MKRYFSLVSWWKISSFCSLLFHFIADVIFQKSLIAKNTEFSLLKEQSTAAVRWNKFTRKSLLRIFIYQVDMHSFYLFSVHCSTYSYIFFGHSPVYGRTCAEFTHSHRWNTRPQTRRKKQQEDPFHCGDFRKCVSVCCAESSKTAWLKQNTAPETYLNSINIKLACLVCWLERKSCVRWEERKAEQVICPLLLLLQLPTFIPLLYSSASCLLLSGETL